jgi:hypothetical protein
MILPDGMDPPPVILGIKERRFRRRKSLHSRLKIPHGSRQPEVGSDQQSPDKISRRDHHEERPGNGRRLENSATVSAGIRKDTFFGFSWHDIPPPWSSWQDLSPKLLDGHR